MLPGCKPWPDELARLYREQGLWREETLWDLLETASATWPNRVALVHGQERISYRELRDRALRLAGGLATIGLRPLDRVVFQLGNTPAFVETFFALMRLAVIPVMALPVHRKAEVFHFLRHSAARGYVIPDVVKDFDFTLMAEELRPTLPELRHVIVSGEARPGQHSIAHLGSLRSPASPACGTPGEVALMLLSGGTTAMSKLIPRTHQDYALNARLCARAAGLSGETVFMAVLPLAHNYNLASPGILATFQVGGRVVLAPSGDAETVFGLVEHERVTTIAGVVPLIIQWLNSDAPDRHDHSSLKLIQNGGARLAPELRRRLRERLGCFPQEVYGTGEGLINMTRVGDPDELLLESSGAPVSELDEIKVLGPEDRAVPDGEPGELAVRGPYTIRGYYAAPEADRKAFTPDGFYRMGDVVRKRGRYVWAEGRKGDLINRGGEKISVDEVEDFILRFRNVRSVAVVAMPDPLFGERACAFVIPKDPAQPPTLQELTAFLKKCGIAKFKWPERLEVVSEFPVSPVGKILRRKLREMIEQKLAPETTKTEERTR
jgi:2,3-dihydroxybenzoate-AMP ligase